MTIFQDFIRKWNKSFITKHDVDRPRTHFYYVRRAFRSLAWAKPCACSAFAPHQLASLAVERLFKRGGRKRLFKKEGRERRFEKGVGKGVAQIAFANTDFHNQNLESTLSTRFNFILEKNSSRQILSSLSPLSLSPPPLSLFLARSLEICCTCVSPIFDGF